MRFLCDLTNIFNNSTFVPVRVSLFCFFCSFHSCLIHYVSNNSFVLLTFFSHHLWVNKVKRRTGTLILVIVIRRSAKRSLLLHLTLLCQFLRCSYISTLNFIVTFYVTLPISSLQFSFTNAKRVYSLSHFIVPPTRKSFVTFFFALSIPCFANSFVAVFHQRSFVLFLVPAFCPSTIQGFFYYTTLLPPTKRSINNFLFGLFCVFTW